MAKRFINADELTSTGQGTIGNNMFVYCGNNPAIRIDYGGNFWDTVFDVISLGASIFEVCVNPTDPWAWVSLAGDVVDLIPFVTGVGEVTKTIRVSVKAVDETTDVVQSARRIYNMSDAPKALRKLTGSYEISYESGYKYVGKGGFYRSTTSAKYHSSINNDRVVSITWTSTKNSRLAFIDEYKLQLANNFKNGGLLYNSRWSPGRRLVNETK